MPHTDSSNLSPQSIEDRVEALLAQMTLEEKVSLCHAGSKFAVNSIPRLGIPEFAMSDGPHGVRHEISRDSWDAVITEDDRSTYLPTGTALAATWNPSLARRFGEVLGAEARHRGKDIILGPGINIIRTPLCGRNFEYFSEDPHLISQLVVPQIEGIQSQGVAACVKHYAANSQEWNRTGVDARMDERTLREIYLPAFEAAVAVSYTAMGAYNKFRGQYCCHNEYLVNGILKGEWGWDGCFISDWAGVHDTVEAAKYGCDIEMGTSDTYEDFHLARRFRGLIEQGDLGVALVDDKVRRNLRAMFRAGVFDPARPAGERNTPEHQQAALEIAHEAIVLLKNEASMLPLNPEKLRKLVVIGDNAVALHASGGHSSGVKALYEVTPLQGLRDRLGADFEIAFFRGYPAATGEAESIDPQYLAITDHGAGTRGWTEMYWTERHFRGDQVSGSTSAIDFTWTETSPCPGVKPGHFSAKWQTTLTPPETGSYEFVLTGSHQATFLVDGIAVIHRYESGAETTSITLNLEAQRAYTLLIELQPSRADLRVKLGWVPPWSEKVEPDSAEMLASAKDADAVLFFGGLNHQYDLEGTDRRDMSLHDGQTELIIALAAVNPRLAVILLSGSPVEMPWIDHVPAIVQMWYAGMEGGHAIADILLGRVNPSGKLPVTFPRRLQDSPAHYLEDYEADVCHYMEGIFVGYRWFDAKNIAPLFPFGHGLSYSTFALSEPEISSSAEGVSLSIRITNTSKLPGAEVIQVYVGPTTRSETDPLRQLKGFRKVRLNPNESRCIDFPLDQRAFESWREESNSWIQRVEDFSIEIGTSSENLPVRMTLKRSLMP